MLRTEALRRDSRDRDKGQAVVEYGGWLVLLLLVAMIAVQVGLAVYAAQQAGTAARAAARVASQDEAEMSPQAAGRAAVSSWLDEVVVSVPAPAGDEATATVTVDVPPLLPWLNFEATRSATMPLD